MTRVALSGVLLAGACLAVASQASAKDITFTYTGTVASFIDVDDVYGFGAGANLAGDAVTDTYVIDLNGPSAAFTGGPLAGGGQFNSEHSFLPSGASSASSTIGGHTVSFDYDVFDYAEQYTSPPAPIDHSLIESQSIGFETTGSAIGSEFLIRDEAESTSHLLPLSLTGGYTRTQAQLEKPGGGFFDGVFEPYDPNATLGSFDITSVTVNSGVPEPGAWAMMLIGLSGLGATMRTRRRALA